MKCFTEKFSYELKRRKGKSTYLASGRHKHNIDSGLVLQYYVHTGVTAAQGLPPDMSTYVNIYGSIIFTQKSFKNDTSRSLS